FAFKSYCLRAFVVASILMMILLALMEFEILAILSDTYGDGALAEQQISIFLSTITFWGSVLVLPFQLFAFNRLVAWAGVERINLVFPSSSLITAFALAAVSYQSLELTTVTIPIIGITVIVAIAIAMLAEFNRTILNAGIRAINDEFLYNAV